MLSQDFKDRMKDLLFDEYDEFMLELEKASVKGVRINKSKLKSYSESDFKDFSITPIPYAEDCYVIDNYNGIGHTPEHHAGIFYVQDPGAMATVSSVNIQEGWKILDLCASPGGKSGQAIAKAGDGGFILANEYVPKRAKILVSNFERLGIKNAIVTSLDTSAFKDMFESYFDLVIADAPCSGEGMFRKNEESISEWSLDNVKACAKRQKEILENASTLVKDGGYLLYSTCTYSVEENEAVVSAFLNEHSDFTLESVQPEITKITKNGVNFDGKMTTDIYKTRRFYPHISKGEGQYIALLKRHGSGLVEKILYKDASKAPSASEASIIEDFFKNNLSRLPNGKIRKYGENLVLISHGVPLPSKSVFSSGVLIGEIRGKNFFPAHHFFSAYGNLFLRQLELSCDKESLIKYLRGEEIDAKGLDNGFAVVTYMGAPIGGGKVSLGKMKNHYPKGLRE